MSRFAAIDVGTNSVLLLVAEKNADGRWVAVEERAEITRLGRGVDKSKALAPEAIEDTVRVIEAYAKDARDLGAQELVVSATSAARDASNGKVFTDEVRQRAGVTVDIISGEDEARLSFASAHADFGGQQPLVVLDIGGGSTEFIYGDAAGKMTFRHSFDVGAVRMTERFVAHDPPTAAELEGITAHLKAAFATLPDPPKGFRFVGVAGTVTTVCAIARKIDPYDAAAVHGAQLARTELDAVVQRLAQLPLALRRTVPGLQPKRADVIVAGALVLHAAMDALGASGVTVSDRGLRWGLLVDRFGNRG